MSINLFFSDAIRETQGFVSEQYKDKSGFKLMHKGRTLWEEGGRLAIHWNSDAPCPEDLQPLLTEVTLHEFAPIMGKREAGFYKHESAEGDMVPRSDGSRDCYWLKLSAKKVEDIKQLRLKMLGGLIHPEVSYENPSKGAQLEAELARTQQALLVANAQLRDFHFLARHTELRRLNVIGRGETVRKIDAILADKRLEGRDTTF